MHTDKSYVRIDEHGVMRIAETRVTIDSVVASFEQGCSAETIAQQYPSLTLEAVYGAITYYLAHTAEVDVYLKRQQDAWNQQREQAERTSSPVVQRLRSQAIRSGVDAE